MTSESSFLRIDMHVHTRHSDGFSKTDSLIKKARKKGIGFAITDHNTIAGAIEAYRLKNKEDIIIPGIELHAKEGPHFLIYFKTLADAKQFHKKHVEKNLRADPMSRTKLSIKDIAALAKDKRYVVGIAHPTGPFWTNIERTVAKNNINKDILKKFHAAEVISGHQPKRANKKAFEFSVNYGLGRIGGSDAHSLNEFGNILTIAHAKSIGEFLKSIREKNSIVVGKETKFYRKAFSQMNIMRKHLSYTRPYLTSKMNRRMEGVKHGVKAIKAKRKLFMEKINKLKQKRKKK